MNGIRAEIILALGILPVVFMSGCSSFVKETYLAGKSGKQWKQVFATEHVVYQCDKRHVYVLPTVLESKALVDMFVFIPIPSDHFLKVANDSEQYELTLDLRPGSNTCMIDDILLNVQNENNKPIAVSQEYDLSAVTSCRYRFNIPVKDLTTYTISFNSPSWGCRIPPLEMERKSGVHNYAPP